MTHVLDTEVIDTALPNPPVLSLSVARCAPASSLHLKLDFEKYVGVGDFKRRPHMKYAFKPFAATRLPLIHFTNDHQS
jgi:hypothetical protein